METTVAQSRVVLASNCRLMFRERGKDRKVADKVMYTMCNKTIASKLLGATIKNYPLKRRFQQRKLPKDAGEWPAISIKTAR
jgi:hypothetical protein